MCFSIFLSQVRQLVRKDLNSSYFEGGIWQKHLQWNLRILFPPFGFMSLRSRHLRGPLTCDVFVRHPGGPPEPISPGLKDQPCEAPAGFLSGSLPLEVPRAASLLAAGAGGKQSAVRKRYDAPFLETGVVQSPASSFRGRKNFNSDGHVERNLWKWNSRLVHGLSEI